VYENWVLRRISGPKGEVRDGWGKKDYIRKSFTPSNISVTQLRTMI
jgi:hypothetical protein